MLSKRTNILFDQKMWQKLSQIAQKHNTSVGNLTREAIAKTYFPQDSQSEQEKRKEAVKTIRKIREEDTTKQPKEDIVTMIRKMREERGRHIFNLLSKKK